MIRMRTNMRRHQSGADGSAFGNMREKSDLIGILWKKLVG